MKIPNPHKDPTGQTWLLQTRLVELGFDPGKIDNDLGPKTKAALKAFAAQLEGADLVKAIASSFADPQDLKVFKECKARGHSDVFCFKTGDNGIGSPYLGSLKTAQEHTPMCALRKEVIAAKWGSVVGGRGKIVTVFANDFQVDCILGDILGVEGRVDLNPAAALELGLKPPFTVPAMWCWKENEEGLTIPQPQSIISQ